MGPRAKQLLQEVNAAPPNASVAVEGDYDFGANVFAIENLAGVRIDGSQAVRSKGGGERQKEKPRAASWQGRRKGHAEVGPQRSGRDQLERTSRASLGIKLAVRSSRRHVCTCAPVRATRLTASSLINNKPLAAPCSAPTTHPLLFG